MTTTTKAKAKTAPRRKAAPKAAPKARAKVQPKAQAEAVSTIQGLRETVTNRVETVRESMNTGFDSARETAGKTATAFGAAGKAYFTGIGAIGRTLLGFGREAYTDTVEHIQASFQAKDMRAVAELQAAFLQNRVEQSAAHANELVEVARDQMEASIKPIIELLDEKKAA